ncbi:MAG: signal peptidase I [Sphingomonadaceae bacterium]
MTDTDRPAPAPAKPAKSETRDFLEFLLKLGIFVFILRSFIFAPFSIPSESMVPRLLVGDYLVVSKWSYGYSRHSFPFSIPLIPGPGRLFESLPERGDVVVFKQPPNNDVDFIKRVIGLPGDMIEVRGGQIVINGTAVPKQRLPDFVFAETPTMRCYGPQFAESGSDGKRRCRYPRFRETLPGGRTYDVLDIGPREADDTQVYVVPAGNILTLGDNRDNSADSRFEAGGYGFVPLENLVGKAQVTVFSTDGTANWLLPWTWFTAARWQRIGEGF